MQRALSFYQVVDLDDELPEEDDEEEEEESEEEGEEEEEEGEVRRGKWGGGREQEEEEEVSEEGEVRRKRRWRRRKAPRFRSSGNETVMLRPVVASAPPTPLAPQLSPQRTRPALTPPSPA